VSDGAAVLASRVEKTLEHRPIVRQWLGLDQGSYRLGGLTGTVRSRSEGGYAQISLFKSGPQISGSTADVRNGSLMARSNLDRPELIVRP
jgi:hypothetical protein